MGLMGNGEENRKKHEDKLQSTRKIPSVYIGINWDKSEVWDKTLQLYK